MTCLPNMNKVCITFLLVCLTCISLPGLANSQAALWQTSLPKQAFSPHLEKRTAAKNIRRIQVNTKVLENTFREVNQSINLRLPLPNGEDITIRLTPSAILSADLAQKFPHFMTYKSVQIGAEHNFGRFSISHLGLFGMFKYQDQWMLLSPEFTHNTEQYASYWYKDQTASQPKANFKDAILTPPQSPFLPQTAQKSANTTGDSIRTFRLAISTTAEYTQQLGGTVDSVVAELMNLVNRINQILEIDLAIKFELVDNQDIIFFDAETDPFTNSDASSDIESNQQAIDNAVGSQNYDIGHLLSTNGGGLAYVGVMCNPQFKAQGYTGLSRPKGERFYIDLVAHELGHQLGAKHSFNAEDSGSCQDSRSDQAAYEPGSGSTIMAYAGICDEQDLQEFSDPYFHASSIQAIHQHIAGLSSQNCGVQQSTGNQAPEIQLAQQSYSIPAHSPFVLQGAATDADNDPLTYSWEQYNNGGNTGATHNASELNADNGSNPLFRSFSPINTPERYFPKLEDVIKQSTSIGETYATTERNLLFRLTVRDGHGGVSHQDTSVAIKANLTSFNIDSPVAWQGSNTESIHWQIGDTQLSPINCAKVDLLLDTNNQQKFAISLASAIDNDGQHSITVPNINSDISRLMLKCSDNIFYAISPTAFPIIAVEPSAPKIVGQQPVQFAEDSEREIVLQDLIVEDPDSSYPEDFSLRVMAGENYRVALQTVIPDENFNGSLSVNVLVNDGDKDSNEFALQVQVTPINDAPQALDDSLTVQQDSSQVSIDVLANDSDIDQDELTLMSFSYAGQGTVSISQGLLLYTPAAGFSGSETITYTVSDAELTAQANLTINVRATVVSGTDSSSSSGGSLIWLTLLAALTLVAKSLTKVRIKYIILIVSTSLLTACAESNKQVNLPYSDAKSDAQVAIKNRQFALLTFAGRGQTPPGIEAKHAELKALCGYQILPNSSDALTSQKQHEQRKALYQYAVTYNTLVAAACLAAQ
ncbi:reprolysin-like metallopeptidase [Paraglaciecola aestuariivivens]